eukprot:m.220848 g.220848  ORF g.220848 m.220848 type:complete len:131 (-) comp31450_c0_seq1:172-564(-)
MSNPKPEETNTAASPETETDSINLDDVPKDVETEVWDSKKQQTFVESGLKDPATQEFKKCYEMGGVGVRTYGKLAYRGITEAYQLIGRYMENKMEDEKMDDWLHDTLKIKDKRHRATITGTMRKWCDQHL